MTTYPPHSMSYGYALCRIDLKGMIKLSIVEVKGKEVVKIHISIVIKSSANTISPLNSSLHSSNIS